jgi:hypothetical protein
MQERLMTGHVDMDVPGGDVPGWSIIRVHRQEMPWRDRYGKWRVLVDGRRVGVIANGETREFRVSPGVHRVRLATRDKIFASPQRNVSLSQGAVAEFTCRPWGPPILSVFAFLWPRRYIGLDRIARWD